MCERADFVPSRLYRCVDFVLEAGHRSIGISVRYMAEHGFNFLVRSRVNYLLNLAGQPAQSLQGMAGCQQINILCDWFMVAERVLWSASLAVVGVRNPPRY